MCAQDRNKSPDRSANEQNGLSPSYTQPPLAAAMYARAFAINPAAIGIIRFDDGHIIDANQAWQEMFGYSREEALGRSAVDLHLWPASEARNHFLEELQKEGSFRNRELTVLRKSGQSLLVLCSAEIMTIEDEPFMVSSWLDITERKRADEALRKSENLLRAVTDNSPDAVYVKDRESRWLMANPAVLGIVGKTAEEAIGKTDLELYDDPQIGHAILENDRHILEQGKSKTFEEVVDTTRGRRTFLSIKTHWRDEKGDIIGIIGISHDITERKQAEEALRESEYFFRESQRAAFTGSYKLDFISGVWTSSEVLNQIFGIDQNYRKTIQGWLDIIHPDDLDMMNLYLKEDVCALRKPFDREYRIVRKTDGETRWVHGRGKLGFDDSGNLLSMIGTIQDITERNKAEEEKLKLEDQLQQAQKMESVGRLAGGIAHDFNNMLSVILGHTDIALEQSDPKQPLYADLAEIQKAARRSADLTRQLLAFARKQTITPIVLDLNETISGMIKMLQRLIGEGIILDWLPSSNLWAVMADPSQIDQILANLCVNARDAIADVGRITLETRNCILDEKHCAAHAGFIPGEYVRLTVSDNGCGIDGETLAHIFEPFFTTKGVGAGTGLGLATVYGAVKQNNGFITVDSSEQGTTITIYFPPHKGQVVKSRTEDAGLPKRGQETILLVEDEPAILKLATTILKRLGYTVLAASSPGEAIRLAREHSGEIHLLMTDVIMPEMNGYSLAKSLQSLYPNLKCLFMSGYTADVMTKHGVLEDGICFIPKPFTAQSLAIKICEALDQA